MALHMTMPRVTAGSTGHGQRSTFQRWVQGGELTEETSADSEEDPNIDHQAEAECNSDVQQHNRAEARGLAGGRLVTLLADVRYLRTGKRKEQEHSGANELADSGHEVCVLSAKPNIHSEMAAYGSSSCCSSTS